jgi:hypothetical protein
MDLMYLPKYRNFNYNYNMFSILFFYKGTKGFQMQY